MNPDSRKRLSGSLILVMVSLGLSIALGEILLRQVLPVDAGTSFIYRVPHPVLGWVLEPNATYINRLKEGNVRVTYNSRGWHDVEHTLKKPEGVFRILVLGDSFMEAYSVELEDAFPRRLEEAAQQIGQDIEVVNLGVGGYGTLQEYLAYREIGRSYQPDLVLLGFYIGNDVRNNSQELESVVITSWMKAESRPFLDTAEPGVWRIKEPNYAASIQRYEQEKSRRDTFRNRLTRQCAWLQAIEKATTKAARLISVDNAQAAMPDADLSPADKTRRDMAVYGMHYCQEPAEYSSAWNSTALILERLKKEVEAAGSHLFVFTVPALYEVDVPAIEKVKADVLDPESLCWDEAPGYGRLKELLSDLNIDNVDLLPAFRRRTQDEGINLYHRSDRHWNPTGHALAADIVMSALAEKKHLLPDRKMESAQQDATAVPPLPH